MDAMKSISDLRFNVRQVLSFGNPGLNPFQAMQR
jgi:hypothetical protein